MTYKDGSVSSFNIAGVFYSDLVTNIKDSVEIDIGTDVTQIQAGTFYNCVDLVKVTIPETINGMGDGVFDGCAKLPTITIPSSVTYLGNSAFVGCSSLTSVLFKGKTLAQVQAMDNYPFAISDTSIIHAELS